MTHYPTHQSGFGLIETMVVVIIIGILVTFAYPAIISTLQSWESKRVESELKQALRQARAQTYISKADTTLCITDTTHQCNRLGQYGLLLFVDQNKNTRLDSNETTLYYTNLNLKYGSVVVNASAHRNHIRYQGNTGKPTGHFGHILYCSPSDNKRLSFKLILNAQGGVRIQRQDLLNIGC